MFMIAVAESQTLAAAADCTGPAPLAMRRTGWFFHVARWDQCTGRCAGVRFLRCGRKPENSRDSAAMNASSTGLSPCLSR